MGLNDLTYNSSGLYKCEVSSDAPDFKTDTKNGSLSVIGKVNFIIFVTIKP